MPSVSLLSAKKIKNKSMCFFKGGLSTRGLGSSYKTSCFSWRFFCVPRKMHILILPALFFFFFFTGFLPCFRIFCFLYLCGSPPVPFFMFTAHKKTPLSLSALVFFKRRFNIFLSEVCFTVHPYSFMVSIPLSLYVGTVQSVTPSF